MATVNQAVGRVLTAMFRYGVFNRTPAGTASTAASTPAHQADARAIAEQGSVLLQNTGHILPLEAASAGSIAVIGADGGSGADTATTSGSSAHVSGASVVTPYQGIQAAAGSSVPVTYNDGSSLTSAAAAASAAKVAVVFVSDPAGEGADLRSLSLPGNQDQLIEAVAKANPDTVVVINSGNPVLMPWLSQVKGVIEGWYPGQEDGSAIAALLFGTVDPSGKLPMTFPQSATQTPTSSPQQWPGQNGQVDYSEGLGAGYRGYDAQGIAPLFPFGFGLSYTSFQFSDLQVSRADVDNQVFDPNAAAGTSPQLLTVSARVTNTGSRAGAEVAQLYLGDPSQAGEPPRQLAGFDKVELSPGQSAQVKFNVDARALSYWDTAASGWVVPDGTYQVSVGDSSAAADLPLHGSFRVDRTVGARYVHVTAPATARPGTTATVTASYVNEGDDTLTGTSARLDLPAGWSAAGSAPPVGSLAPGQTVTRTYHVQVPESAQGTTGTVRAVLSYAASGGQPGQAISGTARVQVPSLVSTTASEPLVQPGASGTATLSFTNVLPRAVTVHYTASAPTGLTVTPATGSVVVPPAGGTTSVTVAVAPGTAPGAYQVGLHLTATDQGQDYSLPPAAITAAVPYGSLAGAFNNVGITDDSDHTPGNFDGSGNSYSAQALAAAGITPGGTVHSGGLTFTWPDAAAGQADNVGLTGQPVALQGSGSELGFLGAAVNATQSFSGTVVYTDGSTSKFTLTFPDWFSSAPASGDQLVATLPYLNRTNGKPLNPVSLFEASVPIDAAKTVAGVILPDAGTATLMHVFAMTVGTP